MNQRHGFLCLAGACFFVLGFGLARTGRDRSHAGTVTGAHGGEGPAAAPANPSPPVSTLRPPRGKSFMDQIAVSPALLEELRFSIIKDRPPQAGPPELTQAACEIYGITDDRRDAINRHLAAAQAAKDAEVERVEAENLQLIEEREGYVRLELPPVGYDMAGIDADLRAALRELAPRPVVERLVPEREYSPSRWTKVWEIEWLQERSGIRYAEWVTLDGTTRGQGSGGTEYGHPLKTEYQRRLDAARRNQSANLARPN